MPGASLETQSNGAADPLAPDVGVVGLVPNQWTDLWQPRHQVMRRLATYFNVVWMNPAPEWRRTLAPRIAEVVDTEGPGWRVLDAPAYLPIVYRPRSVGMALARARLARARRALVSRGARRIVLYLWRPKFEWSLATPHDLSVYHIDDEYSPSNGGGVDPAEAKLIQRVDQVIIHSPRLMERKGRLNPSAVQVPNGVDYRAFSTPKPEPADLAGIPRPRIGYAGWLKSQLDWSLVDQLAAAAPEWSFVFAGAIKHDRELEQRREYQALRERPNVHFLGRKSSWELSAYAQHFDVCMMPYALTPYTDCIYPLKLNEYLASGRPTVGSPIRALEDYRQVVTLAGSVA